MAGVKVRRVYKLTFEGDEFEGWEVRAKSLSVEKVLDASQIAEMFDGKESSSGLSKEQRARMLELFGLFGEALVSWNLEEDDDTPISADVKGLLSLELGQAMAIIMSWLNVVTTVSTPLAKPSTNGATSVEGLIPMEPLSVSQAS